MSKTQILPQRDTKAYVLEAIDLSTKYPPFPKHSTIYNAANVLLGMMDPTTQHPENNDVLYLGCSNKFTYGKLNNLAQDFYD